MRSHRRAVRSRLDVELLEARWVPAIAGAFLETPLVSDQAGVAPVTDATLINAWGIAVNPTGAFWVSSGGGGVSEVYLGNVNSSPITAPFKVTIPGGSPTGQVFNGTTDFVVTDGINSGAAAFIFASEAGTVTGWNPNVGVVGGANPPSLIAATAFTALDGAIYKGIALANNRTGNFLYLADFHNNKIDVLNATFQKQTLGAGGFGTFTDPNLPAGFAPFNVAAINGKLYVSYAKQDATATDDVAGAGNGFISVFDLSGNFQTRLISQGALNSPWAMVVAPTGFSTLGGDLLVGNFGDGEINVYNPTNGTSIGTLLNANRQPLAIDGLWGMAFGNGTAAGDAASLYFAAGPGGEAHGLFGKITSPARGGDGAAGQVVVVSGQANGSASEFALRADDKLATQGNPISPFSGFAGDVRSATGDVNGDGTPDIIVVTGPGTPLRYAVINGVDRSVLVAPTAAFVGSELFAGGGFVSAGDIDGDGKSEWVITPDQGGGPRVTEFGLNGTTATVKANFLGIDDVNFRGGARSALGDVNGDGVLDLAVAAGFGGGPRIAVFSGTTLTATPTRIVNDFFAFPGTDAVNLRNGAFVTLGDYDGDGMADFAFGGGPGGGPRVFVLSGKLVVAGDIQAAYNAPLANFFAFDSSQRGGVRVATKEANGDGDRELVVGSGEGRAPTVIVFAGTTLRGSAPTGVTSTPFTDPLEAAGIFVG